MSYTALMARGGVGGRGGRGCIDGGTAPMRGLDD
jgi:hypothetical protein